MTDPPHPRQVPIAVVGVSALLPGCDAIEDFWRAVLTGRDLITEVPPTHWLAEDYYDPDPSAVDKTYSRRGAFLGPTDFDTLSFGIPPKALAATDTTQLLTLVAVEQVLTDAFGDRTAPDGENVGVVLGTAAVELLYTMAARMQRPVWLKALRESGVAEPEAQRICDRIAGHYPEWQEETFPGLLDNVVAGRVANRFDFHGANFTTDAACASSLAALSAAVDQLSLGRADVMITGGADTANDILMYMCFSKTPAMSPSGDCRPFSDRADGTVLGEGVVVYALKRLADAERDGDRVYGVIRGVGSSSDGRGAAVYTPVPQGQARALRRAYRAAGYGPETVELVEAHGTGTKAGDAAEAAGLHEVFGSGGDRPRCAVGSVKSQLGHLKSAAGAVGLLKALLAVNHGVLPATAKVERPNPDLHWDDGPLYLNTAPRPWVRDGSHPRRAAVSSFGFGGSNFHVTIEEYRPGTGSAARRAPRFRALPAELVPLSASSPAELLARLDELAEGGPLTATARTAQGAFRFEDAHRAAFVAGDRDELLREVDRVRRQVEARPEEPFSTPAGSHYAAGEAEPGGLCLLFPGQGSQYPGMGGDVAMHLPKALAAWDLAASVAMGERALHEVAHPVPVFTDADREAQRETLTRTEWAQPALAVNSLALLEVLRSLGIRPDFTGGHSLGELVALHAADVMDAPTLVRLARERGELMAGVNAEPGAMLAVSAPPARVRELLRALGDDGLWVANHNGPDQVVVSGRVGEVERLKGLLDGEGIRSRRLAVSHAFHSPLVAEAGEPLLGFLSSVPVRRPSVPVLGNRDAAPYPDDPDEIRRTLAGQLSSPVRFAEQVEALYRRGARTFVEVGAGSVLTGLVDAVLGDRPHRAISTDSRRGHGVASLFDALGRLAVAGVRMDFTALWESYGRGEPEPKPTADRATVPILGANCGKRYPPEGGAVALPPPVPSQPAPPMTGAVPAGPPVPAAPSRSAPDPAWLAAVTDTQRETAAAHAAYQKAMGDSHTAFLKLAEVSLAGMAAVVNGDGTSPAADIPRAPEAPPAPAPLPEAVLPAAPVLLPEAPAHLPPPLGTPPGTVPAPAPTPAPLAEPEREPAPADLESVLLAVVADKTGYPVEMLNGEMDLEADLGIDSIKRVEVLSALRQQVDGLPEVEAARLGTLRSLREIADVFGEVVAEGAAATTPAVPAPAPAPSVALEPPPGETPTVPGRAAPPPGRPDRLPLVRLIRRAVPAPLPGLRAPGLSADPVTITADGGGVAEALAAELVGRGIPAEVVTDVPAGTPALVHLGGLRHVGSAGDALVVEHEVFRDLRRVSPRFRREGGLLVTVQDTGGDFGASGRQPERAWLGGVAAAARTAAAEWPDAVVKALDCERGDRAPQEIARVLAAELLEGGPASDIALRADGSRTALALVPASPAERDDRIGPGSVLVVSGGARGITAQALCGLAEQFRPRLVLLGRTPLADEPVELRDCPDVQSLTRVLVEHERERTGEMLTPVEAGTRARDVLAGRELRRALAELRTAGSEVRYLQVDVRDAAAVAAALASVRTEWGPITGIVHAAGVLADQALEDKTDEHFDRVFGTKVDGLRSLLAATATDPLDLICVFSSVAAEFGNVGQADYAMGNEVLTHVALAEQAGRPGCRVRSIAWGPWRGGMVTRALAKRFDERGVPLVDPGAGSAAFVAEVTGAHPDVHVVVAGEGTRTLHGGERRLTAEVVVTDAAHGYLADHSVAGTPVLPVALALEWFRALAAVWRPGGPVTVGDVRVLRKAVLPDLARGGHRFTVRGRERVVAEEAVLEVELLGESGAAHYHATVSASAGSQRSWSPPSSGEPLDPTRVYDGVVLFHGPRFQVLDGPPVLTADGATGVVLGLRAVGWPDGPWHTDPAAVDGALQLAGLWAARRLGGAWLPMSVGRLLLGRHGPVSAPVRCAVLVGDAERDVVTCDARLVDQAGELVAELADVVFVRRPDVPVDEPVEEGDARWALNR
ncbi:SDR family oxidoreductase [Amycolatopsis sp. NPDC051102]|uniref:SDR family oxidoreductase n=1 Tax=Amycolatopsis sp. NPDC051102 TaxID=3155163 RepID=UPI003433D7BB